jgi:hypothetical protein
VNAFDLALFGVAFRSAETASKGEVVAIVEWPDEFFRAWLVRPN